MTTWTADAFETAVGREFSFLSELGFDGPVFSGNSETLSADYRGLDLEIRVTCFSEDDAPVTRLRRPSLGRALLLETLHWLNRSDYRYPTPSGLPFASRAELEGRIAVEAGLLRENLAAARERDELFEEAGGRV